ncbi:NADH-quinone oxidoreductase subunit C [Lysobacteraceae bacterium NML93-0399]|nr:NADH-quinone oxidoreductase subunit C [Xanthomonadaceae bacterium NML93-0399]
MRDQPVRESATDFAARLRARFADADVAVALPRGEVTLTTAGDWLETARTLRDEFGFESLIDVCGVDYLGHGSDEWDTDVSSEGFSRGVEGRGPGRFKFGEEPSRQTSQPHSEAGIPVPQRRFAAVAQLLSIQHNRRVTLKCFAPSDDLPVVSSLTVLWPVANWFEREAFDLFGVIFEGHPDLRRILTDYGFVGHPFRKDFPLIGNVEVRYDAERKRVVYEPVTSVEPRVGVPRVIREDARFATASAEQMTRRAEAAK